MNKETDLSSEWLQAWTLRLWAKGKEKKALGEKMTDIEEQLIVKLYEYAKGKIHNCG